MESDKNCVVLVALISGPFSGPGNGATLIEDLYSGPEKRPVFRALNRGRFVTHFCVFRERFVKFLHGSGPDSCIAGGRCPVADIVAMAGRFQVSRHGSFDFGGASREVGPALKR